MGGRVFARYFFSNDVVYVFTFVFRFLFRFLRIRISDSWEDNQCVICEFKICWNFFVNVYQKRLFIFIFIFQDVIIQYLVFGKFKVSEKIEEQVFFNFYYIRKGEIFVFGGWLVWFRRRNGQFVSGSRRNVVFVIFLRGYVWFFLI